MPSFKRTLPTAGMVVLLASVLALTGCRSIDPATEDGNYPGMGDPIPAEDYEPTEDEINQMMPWDCYYDATMNENWHDDVICRRGTDSFRPSLLEGQFVTENDMIAAGEAYEAELNGSSTTGTSTSSADACSDGKDDWRDVLYDCVPPG
jgi:hypothetical protein